MISKEKKAPARRTNTVTLIITASSEREAGVEWKRNAGEGMLTRSYSERRLQGRSPRKKRARDQGREGQFARKGRRDRGESRMMFFQGAGGGGRRSGSNRSQKGTREVSGRSPRKFREQSLSLFEEKNGVV